MLGLEKALLCLDKIDLWASVPCHSFLKLLPQGGQARTPAFSDLFYRIGLKVIQ
jgi:hypothetical protein